MVPESLIESLVSAKSVVVLSGSGMSAESGIPTFRDALTGLWSRFRPEELATPEAFERDPARVWLWYESRRVKIREARPHAGHEALNRLETLLGDLAVVTQNVDGLHQRAGSRKVLELHGNIMRSVCSRSRRIIDANWISSATDVPPRSPFVAGALARPDVIWFGETLPQGVLGEAMDLLHCCDVCITVGTSALVEPAASLPWLAKRSGACLVEINPLETPVSAYADYCFRESASTALTKLADLVDEAVHA